MRLLKIPGAATAAILVACGGDATQPPAPVLTTISVALTPNSISADQSAIAVASARDQFGAAIPTGVVSWTTANPTVATVSAGGFVTAVAAGTTEVRATIGSISAAASLTVTVVPVARITVTPATIRLVAGGTQQLTAALFDSRGNALSGRTVTWTTSDSTKATVTAAGLVSAVSNGVVAITAQSEGQVGAAAITVGPEPIGSVVVGPAAASLALTATATFTATAYGLTGAALTGRAFTWTSTNPAVASVLVSNGVATVTAVAVGTTTVTASSDGVSGVATVTVTPPPPACPREQALHLAAAEVRVLASDQVASTCLGGDAFASEYVLIPLNGSMTYEDVVRLRITGTNTSAISSSAVASASVRHSRAMLPGRSPHPVPSIARGELAFKNRERAELTARLAAMRGRARGPQPRRQVIGSVPSTPAVGAIYGMNADLSTSCGPKQLHGARVVALLPHTIVFADTLAPPGGYSDAELIAFGTAFDTLGFALDTLNFGAPTDIDGNGRIGILFTPGVNTLPAPTGAIVAGLFATRDLLPTTGANACAGSNEGEMFYMPVPDPAKTINGSYADKAFLSTTVAGVLVHEFQHLINTGRRLYVTNAPVAEQVWLNEGLSHIAEELLYYRVSRNAPRSNIAASLILSTPAQSGAYRAYMSDGNIQRLGTYLFAPEVNSPYSDFDELETRGASWELLRYAADRKGGLEAAGWRALVNSATSGQANFEAVFGSMPQMVRDWSVAQFTDDAGLSVSAPYTYPSWNFRSIYPIDDNFGAWPLASSVHGLPGGTTLAVTLAGGGAAYVRFRVNANVVASVTSVNVAGPLPAALSYVLVRTQ